jgi:broad specificity phosphatase PhoE
MIASRADLSRKEIIAGARSGPEIPFWIVRHGATALNEVPGVSVDRERGWSMIPLTAEGAEGARRAALKLRDKDVCEPVIVSSDLPRAQQSADIMGQILGVEPEYSFGLRPWGLGTITNQVMTQARPQIAALVRKPDIPAPQGESFNQFKRRGFKALANAISRHLGKTLVLVCHLRVEALLKGWQAAGQPINHEIDIEAFLKDGDPPGGVRHFTTWLPLVRGELDRKLTHAEANYRKGYEPEWCRTCEYSDHMTAPTCSLVEEITRTGWCRLWDKAD